MFRLWYHVENGGDGSANTRFHLSEANAEKADEEQCEGWGESSVGSVDIVVRNGKAFMRKGKWNKDKKKYDYILLALEEVQDD